MSQELVTVFSRQQAAAANASSTTATPPSLDANQQAIVNAVVQSITHH